MEEKGNNGEQGKDKKPEFVPKTVQEIRDKKESETQDEKPEIKEVKKKPKLEFSINDANNITVKDVETVKKKLDELIEAKEHPMTVPSIEYFRTLAQLPPEERPKMMPVRMKRVKLPKLIREKPKTLEDDPKHPAPRKKVAIVGFAETTRMEAPFNDPTFEIWGLNELYLAIPRADRWFEIHAENNIKNSFRDARHWEWLKGCQIPVYMTKKYKEIKSCKVYPIKLMIRLFGPIFSSSIAEMMAMAIYEGFNEIHLYGVDMAMNKEYGAQKSGCEYFIGLAVGLGIKTYIPVNSDLMKVGFQYGYDDPTEFSIKLKQKHVELIRKKAAAAQAEREAHDGGQRLIGALELCDYLQDNYVQMVVNQRYKHQ